MVAVLMKLCLQFAQYGTINIHVKTQSVVLVVCYICLCVYLPTYSFNCTFWKWQTQSNTPNRMRFDYQKNKSYPNTVSLQIDHHWFIINGFQRVYWKFSNFCPKYPGPKSYGLFEFYISSGLIKSGIIFVRIRFMFYRKTLMYGTEVFLYIFRSILG